MKTKEMISTCFKLLRLLSWKGSTPLVLSAACSAPIFLLNRGSRFIEQGILFPLVVFALSLGAYLLDEYLLPGNSLAIWVLAALVGVGTWSLLGVVTITFYARLKESTTISALKKLRQLFHAMPKGDLLPPFLEEDLRRAEKLKDLKTIAFLRRTIHELAKPNRQAIRQLQVVTELLDNLLALFASLRQSLWLNFYGTQIATTLLTYLVTLFSFGLLYRAVSHQNPAAFLPPGELSLSDAIYLSFFAAITMGGGDLHPQATIAKWAYLLQMITTFLSLTIFLGIGITVLQTASGEDLGTVGPAILKNKRRAMGRLCLSILKAFPNIRFKEPTIPEPIMKELNEIHVKLKFAEAMPSLFAVALISLCDGKTASQVGPDGIKTVMSALDNEHPIVRTTGARCLGAIKATAAIERLTALLQDSDPEVRLAAADSLAAIRVPKSTKSDSKNIPKSDPPEQ